MQTKLMKHNKYNNKIQLNKKYWQELGFKENDKISISKLEDGKIVVESLGQFEKENSIERIESLNNIYPDDVNFLETVKLLKVVERIGDDENV